MFWNAVAILDAFEVFYEESECRFECETKGDNLNDSLLIIWHKILDWSGTLLLWRESYPWKPVDIIPSALINYSIFQDRPHVSWCFF